MNDTHSAEPQPLASDYVQMGLHLTFLLIGLPINLTAAIQMGRLFQNCRSRIYLLYLNLSISDMLVLIFHSLVRCCWILTYKWMGGDTVCRLVKFLESLGFGISSNVMVCIAIDRLYSLHRPFNAHRLARVVRMLWTAWILATVTSVPQIFLYEVFEPFPNFPQCTNKWQKEINLFVRHNGSQEVIDSTLLQMTFYEIYHVVAVFWLPLVILSICYAMILKAIDKRQAMTVAEAHSIDSRHSSVCEGLRRVSGGNQLARARSRTIRTTLMLVTIYMACWLPYNSLSLWHIVSPVSYQLYQDTLYFLNALVVLNSAVNPLVYSRTQLCDVVRQRRGSHRQPRASFTPSKYYDTNRKSVTFQLESVALKQSSKTSDTL